MVGDGKRGEWTTAIDLIPQHEEEKEEKDENYARRERRCGSFSRTIALPSGVDADKIKATSKDGVVEVTIPLLAEKKASP